MDYQNAAIGDLASTTSRDEQEMQAVRNAVRGAAPAIAAVPRVHQDLVIELLKAELLLLNRFGGRQVLGGACLGLTATQQAGAQFVRAAG